MNLGTISAPKSFNPVTARETSTTDVTGLMFLGLTGVDGETGRVEPELARSWEQKSDGREWIFDLREGLKWSDGEPLTAEDVVFTYRQLYLNRDVETSTRFALLMEGQPPEVEKLSKHRVKFTYPRPYVPFPRATSAAIMPEHVFEGTTASDFNHAWGVNTDPGDLVVNGPFKLERYAADQRVVLADNPNYYKNLNSDEKLPRLDRLVYHVVGNTDIQVQRFLRGEIDAIGVQPRMYPVVKQEAGSTEFKLHRSGPSLGSLFLAFNMNTDTNPRTGETYIPRHKLAWFNDPEFRRAVSRSIDRGKISQIVYNGLASPRYGPVSPANELFYDTGLKSYGYDPELAREILNENGYVDGNGDGVIEGPEGHPVEFVLLTNSGNEQRVETAEIIRQDLSNLGFRVTFRQVEFNTLVSQMNSDFDWEAVVMGFTGSLEPHFGSNVWLSSGDLHLWHPFQEEPEREWEAEIDRLFQRGVRTVETSARREVYSRWQRVVNRRQPLIYTVTGEVIHAVQNRVENLKPTAIGGLTHNIEHVSIRNRAGSN